MHEENHMEICILEKNKQPGVCYAVTDDGIELPVIDITHPAFAFTISEAQLNALIEVMVRSASIPPAALQAAAQKSILLRGFTESADTYTSGMMTYLNKLGPNNLGDGYANALDRQFAASLTPVTFRWRMRDAARLLADGLAPALAARPGSPLHMINIAGGPSADSLNALILLQKEHPELLAGRSIIVHVLDIDAEGPHFGARALAALQTEGGPLHGLAADFEYLRYDWNDPALLSQVLNGFEKGAVAAGSSEGGLFEYAADETIITNLKVLHAAAPADFVMVGPVIRSAQTLDPRLRMTEHTPGRPAVRYIGLEAFQKLAGAAGWTIERSLDGPMHQVVSLKKV
jgi:hypothetical protein